MYVQNMIVEKSEYKDMNLRPAICIGVQHTATHCNTLQHTATHCNTLQHTATQKNTKTENCEDL